MNFEYFADWPPALFYFGVLIPAIAVYLSSAPGCWRSGSGAANDRRQTRGRECGRWNNTVRRTHAAPQRRSGPQAARTR